MQIAKVPDNLVEHFLYPTPSQSEYRAQNSSTFSHPLTQLELFCITAVCDTICKPYPSGHLWALGACQSDFTRHVTVAQSNCRLCPLLGKATHTATLSSCLRSCHSCLAYIAIPPFTRKTRFISYLQPKYDKRSHQAPWVRYA